MSTSVKRTCRRRRRRQSGHPRLSAFVCLYLVLLQTSPSCAFQRRPRTATVQTAATGAGPWRASVPDLVRFPSEEVAFIAGPQLKSGSALNPAPRFDRTASEKGVHHGEAFPAVPPPFDPVSGDAMDAYINLNYYDQALVQYINYYRTGDARFLNYARKIADSWWKVHSIDEGRREPEASFAPRNSSLAGLMLRALDGRPEMWPWITRYTREQYFTWVERPTGWWKGMTDDQLAGRAPRSEGGQMVTKPAGFYYGVRDGGYMLLHAANLARVHPDASVRAEFKAKVLDGAVNYYARTQRVVAPADGGFYFELTEFGIQGLTTQPFQEGLLAEGLIAVHRLTGDETVKQSIVRLAEHLYNRAYNKDGWRAMYYFVGGKFTDGTDCTTGCGTAAGPFPPADANQVAEARHLNPPALHTFGYAYLLTGNETFKQWGDEVFDSSFTGIRDPYRCLAWARAKEYDETYRSTGRYLAWRLGVGSTPTTPTPESTVLAVNITSPASTTMLPAGEYVNVTATAVSSESTVSRVDFYADGQFIGASATAPYNVSWGGAGVGSHALTAKATDSRGVSSMSSPVFVNVAVPANSLPTVSITSPAAYAEFREGADISISAAAADSDGSVARVDFYAGTQLIGTTSTNHVVLWNSVPAGNYTLTAIATDNSGGQTTSDPVSIRVLGVRAGKSGGVKGPKR